MPETVFQELKRYIRFGDEDERALRSLHAAAAPRFEQIADTFYERILTHDEARKALVGGESQVVPYEQLSVVTAPYEVDGRVVGTLGVIGPTRMPYERMIQIVDITARLVGHALSHK